MQPTSRSSSAASPSTADASVPATGLTASPGLSYSPYVQPTTLDGVKCVLVDKRLKTADPLAYGFLQDFARSNELLTENAD